MLRRLRLFLVAPFLGVVTTVLVAWTCAFVIDIGKTIAEPHYQPSDVDGVRWSYAVRERPGAARVTISPVRLHEMAPENVAGHPTLPDEPPASVQVFRAGWPGARPEHVEGWGIWPAVAHPRAQDARGWPWLALSSEFFVWGTGAVDAFGEPLYDVRADRGLVVRKHDPADAIPQPIIAPLGVVWPGFVNCVAFYTVAWLIVLSLPGAGRSVRRLVRSQRGQCATCGYPIAAAAGMCPECGSPTSAR